MSKKYRYRISIALFSAILFLFMYGLSSIKKPQKNKDIHVLFTTF